MGKGWLAYGAFEGDGEELLCFDSELHRELVHHFFGVAIDDEPDRFLYSYATLLAVEDLVFADLAGRSLVLDDRRIIIYVDVGEGVCSTAVTQ